MAKKEHSYKEIFSKLGINIDTSKDYSICPFCLKEGKVKKTFGADENTGIFNCFRCNNSGKRFQFVMDYLELDDTKTKEWFRKAFWGSDYTPPEPNNTSSIPSKKAKDGKQYTDIYNRLFKALPMVKQSNYLVQERCLSLEVLQKNNVKEAKPEGFFKITNFIHKEDAINAGIGRINKSGKLSYMFWNCAYIMPLYDGDRIESIQGREAGEEGEYRFLKGIKIPTFYIPKTKLIEQQETIYICEGILTSFAFLTDGLAAMCITSKNYKIDEILRKLEAYKNKTFIFSPDLDGGDGLASMKKLAGLLREKGYNVSNEFHNVMKLAYVENLDYLNTTDYADILKLRSKKNARKGNLK